MAGELKKKILNREQALAAKAEGARKAGMEAGEDGAGEEDREDIRKLKRRPDASGAPHVGEDWKEDGTSETLSLWKRAYIRKAATFAVPAIILAAGVWLYLSEFGLHLPFSGTTKQILQPVTSMKRPIPIPDYREMLDFIVLNETDRQKTMVALRMEFTFNSSNTYQNFKDNNVIFRDTVYLFLQRQNALRYTQGSWHRVVEKDLVEYLRVKLPQSKADKIRLTQVENL